MIEKLYFANTLPSSQNNLHIQFDDIDLKIISTPHDDIRIVVIALEFLF